MSVMNPNYRNDAIPSKSAAGFYGAYFATLGVVLPFLGPFLEHRGVTAVGIGIITALFSLAKVVYAPPLGVMVDRGFWFRGLLTVHMLLAVVPAIALYWFEGPVLLGAAFLVIGLGYGAVLPLIEASILERLTAGGYGLLRLWGSIGFVVVATAAGAVIARAGIDVFPWLMAAAMAVLAVTCLPFERSARPIASSSSGTISAPVWWLLGLLTLNQVAHGPYYAFFSIHLDAAGFSTVAISVAWSIGVLAELVAFVAGGRLERGFGLRRLLGIALMFSPIRWLLLALEPTPVVIVFAQLGHATTFALVHLAGVQLVQASVPIGAIRRAQALYSGLCFGLGIVVGSAAAGPIYATWSGRGAFIAAAGLSVAVFIGYVPVVKRLGSSPKSKV
jgi:PPP family 3-phenylpropionic acid transporter